MADQKDPVALRKVRDLVPYIFVGSGDPNYIPLSELLIPIDSKNVLFNSILPKTVTLAQILGGEISPSAHVEAGRITGLSSVNISESFNLAFDAVPVGRKSLYCWKSVGGYDYTYILKNISILTTGFSCTIEDVTGVAITDFTDIYFEYKFEEQT